MVFNEELFSSNIEALKADYLHVRLDELQQLLSTIEESDSANLQPSAIEEDNKVYLYTKEEAEEEAKEEAEEEAQPEEFPYISSRFKPYPTPSLLPEAVLLAGAIQQASHSATANAMEFELWIAAFAVGQLIQPTGTHGGKTITKATVQRLARRPNGLQTLYSQDLPPLLKSHHQLKNHPFGAQFLQAERDYLQSYLQIDSWTEVYREESQG